MSDRLSLSGSANDGLPPGSGVRAGSDDDGSRLQQAPAASRPLVKWTLLQTQLEGCCIHGIQSFMLIRSDGSPVLFAGKRAFSHVMSGLIAQIWTTFDLDGRDALGSTSLQMQQIVCSRGVVLVTSVSTFLLAAITDQDGQLAGKKKRILELKQRLEGPLSSLSDL